MSGPLSHGAFGRHAIRVGALALVVGGTGCFASPYAAYSSEERALIEGAGAQRKAAAESRTRVDRDAEGFPLSGRMAAGEDMFTGTWVRFQNPFTGEQKAVYDKGVYERANGDVFIGRFRYFEAQRGFTGEIKDPALKSYGRAAYVFVGEALKKNGTKDSGVYIAEDVFAEQPIRLLWADEAYVGAFEKTYRDSLNAFRAEQKAVEEREMTLLKVLSVGVAIAGGLGGVKGLDKVAAMGERELIQASGALAADLFRERDGVPELAALAGKYGSRLTARADPHGGAGAPDQAAQRLRWLADQIARERQETPTP